MCCAESSKQHQYGQIILPFTVLFRLDATLAPTKDAVLEAANGYHLDEVPTAMLPARANHDYSFYNLSRHNLSTITTNPDTLALNLRDYINRFSENVRDIFEKYKFEDTIADLEANDLPYQVMLHFSKVDLHPSKVSNEQMGNILEELIGKFAEAFNEYFTPREVNDPTAGTGDMLSVAEEKIRAIIPTADVTLLGQELNAESYTICKADMVVKGQEVENMALGINLTNPAFETRTFHFGLSKPPIGVDWKGAKKFVEDEHKNMGSKGRFGAGLPRVSDGSLPLLQHLIAKLREPGITTDGASQVGGRVAIVPNDSPLSTGGAGSGEINIREWVLDNDYLEAIIGLPTDMFYNTGISTYIWVLIKQKKAERKGKVQLIDAADMFEKMRKSVGAKRKKLSNKHIAEVAQLFAAFNSADDNRSKIFDREDFLYRTITIERPLRLNWSFTAERVDRLLAMKELAKLKLDTEAQDALAAALASQVQDAGGSASQVKGDVQSVLLQVLADAGVQVKPLGLGKLVAHTNLRDTENVSWGEDIHEYLEREVKPFMPDAWIDESKTRDGAEIPFTRHFYEYVPASPLEEIDRDLKAVLGRIRLHLDEVLG